MSKNNIFMLLLSGLHNLGQNRTGYPLPADLRYSLNFLAFYLGNNFPCTLEGLYNKTRQPLKDWWPLRELPVPIEFDQEAPLTTSDKELSEDAKDFLYDWAEETGVALSAGLTAKNSAGDNLVIKQLLENLREKYMPASEKERQQIQTEYITIRRFIIQNPYVTSDELRQLSYLRYTNSVEFAGKAYYYIDNHTKDYWQCENCGPLIEKSNGTFTGRKTSVCNDHADLTAKHIKKVAGAQNLRVLNQGLHLRVLIPGVPELRLYDWLLEIREKHPEQLPAVELWPGLDRYDLRLCFNDENWVVDVKDYRSPYSLGKKLTNIYGEGALAYQKSFYVFPAYRLKANYREIALEQATNKPTATELLTDEEFKGRVETKIRQLTKKKKGAK